MNHEDIIALEDLIDKIKHTRECETGPLYQGRRCVCGAADLKDNFEKYRSNLWKENRER